MENKVNVFSQEILVCRNCGSGDLEGMFSINPNKNDVSEAYPSNENDNWCCRCDKGGDLDSFSINAIPETVLDKWWNFNEPSYSHLSSEITSSLTALRAKYWRSLSYPEKQALWLADVIKHHSSHTRAITPCCCPECGSDNVEAKVWLRPNTRNEYVKDCCEDEDYCWCNECNQEITLTHPDQADKTINEWWAEQDFKQMEKITGLRQVDFSPEDGYQEFVDACNNLWSELPREEKFSKRNEDE